MDTSEIQWRDEVIDSDGYRQNVGIILMNQDGFLFWARRIGQDAWQFPQGGIHADESPEQAMYRELDEEIGLQPDDVEILGCTKGWLRYRLPKRFIRQNCRPVCIGQKQIWYLLRMKAADTCVCLDRTDKPEFDRWCWVNYWKPLEEVVSFKRNVYWQALRELSTLLFSEGLVLPEPPRRRRNRRSSELSGRRGLPGNRAGSRRGRVPRG